jgi:photosystem II stability/assembly factor-like uncharacterized protein
MRHPCLLASALLVCACGAAAGNNLGDASGAAAAAGGAPAADAGVPAAGGGGGSSEGQGGAPGDAGGLDDAAPPAPDGPPLMIGACTSLGEPNRWEQINPPGAYVGTFALDPVHAGTVWYTAKGPGTVRGLFKTTDCGHSWTKVNTGMNGDAIDRSSTWSMAIDYVDPNVIYVIGAYGAYGLLKSSNGGVDWKQVFTPGGEVATVAQAGPSTPPLAFIGSVSMDPHDPKHLVVGMHATCKPPYDPSCQAETLDGGETWKIVNVQPFGKGFLEQTGPYVLDESSWLNATLSAGLWLTTDHGQSWLNVTPPETGGATGGEYTHRPFVPAADGTYYLPAYNPGGLLQSRDKGRSWTRVKNAPQGSYEAGFALGGGNIYLGDLRGGSIHVAPQADPTQWTELPHPMQTGSGGPVALEYDEAHHILYAAVWTDVGGLWRMVTP